MHYRLESRTAFNGFSESAGAVVAEPFAIIDWSTFATCLNGLEPWHWQPLACAPLLVSRLAVHEWPSEAFAEVFAAFSNQEQSGFVCRSASMQLFEGLWASGQDFGQWHWFHAWNGSQNPGMFQHTQALEACDVPAW
jgi:hypothetical protein